MNYQDFRKTYSWTLKHYPGTYELFTGDFKNDYIGKLTIKQYEKTGKRWALVDESREDITPYFYFNCVDAIPFFRNLGGYEKVYCGYCVRGYVPLEIVSISPDKQHKTVRTFQLF